MWLYCEIDGFYINLKYMEMAFVDGKEGLFIVYVESGDKLFRVNEFKNEKDALKCLHELFSRVSLHAISGAFEHIHAGILKDKPKRTRKSPKKGLTTHS